MAKKPLVTIFEVKVNKYSHEGSGFSRVIDEASTLAAAQTEADRLWATGNYRFVFVEHCGKTVYAPPSGTRN